MQPKIVFLGHSNFAKMAKEAISTIELPQWVEVKVEEFPYKFVFAEESVPRLKSLYDPATIIISGDRSAQFFRKTLDNFVIPVSVSGFEVFESIKRLDSKEVVVANYRSNIEEISNLSSLINIKITQVVYQNRKEAIEIINELKKKGINHVIGGSWFTETAKKHGMNAICYYTVKGMKEAIYNALNILKSFQSEMEKSAFLRTIVDMNRSGIIACDKNLKIYTVNQSAENLFSIKSENVLGKKLDSFLPALVHESKMSEITEPKYNIIFDYESKKFFADIVPVMINGELTAYMIAIEDIVKLQNKEKSIRKKISTKPLVATYSFNDIKGSSYIMKQTIQQAKKYSKTSSSILIQGESGTGKELFAQSIHQASQRSFNAFVALNCAAIPENLLDSELFGYEEGSFTGAVKGGKPGLFELAHQGTIFLDEISELPLHLQSRLLRVLQEKEIMRIGGKEVIPVDVRIIAASNKDLLECVKEGTFREDLYYRIGVLQLFIPPLRQRKGDIIELFRFFIREEEELNQLLSDHDLQILIDYDWKGNIRELSNVAERFIALCRGETLTRETVKEYLQKALSPNTFSFSNASPVIEKEKNFIIEEKNYILQVLRQTNGNKQEAAERLGISRTTLWRKMKKYNINF